MFYWLHQRHFHFGAHSYVYELILFKLGMNTAATALSMLILVSVIMAFTEDWWVLKKTLNLLYQLSHKFSVHLDEICHTIQTYNSYETHTHLILSGRYSKENFTPLIWYDMPLTLACVFDAHQKISFKLDVVIVLTKTYILILVKMTMTFTQNHRRTKKLELTHIIWLQCCT